jgi:hypothetical protein
MAASSPSIIQHDFGEEDGFPEEILVWKGSRRCFVIEPRSLGLHLGLNPSSVIS